MPLPTNKTSVEEIDQDLKELENEMETDQEQEMVQDDEQDSEIEEEKEEDSEEEEKEEESPEESQSQTQQTENEDYKRKFADSSREAQILLSRNQELTSKVKEAVELADPSDDQLKQQYPDVDFTTLSPFEKKLMVSDWKNNKRFELIHQSVKAAEEIDTWNNTVVEFVEKPETTQAFPEIIGREAEFKSFANKPTHRGVALDVLAKSFTFDIAKTPQNLRRGGNLFESPTNSKGEKKKEISPEAVAKLRKGHPRLWMEMQKPWYKGKKIEI